LHLRPEAASGLQLLEELRRENMLPYSTVFAMPASEVIYAQEAAAAEPALDGSISAGSHLLWPTGRPVSESPARCLAGPRSAYQSRQTDGLRAAGTLILCAAAFPITGLANETSTHKPISAATAAVGARGDLAQAQAFWVRLRKAVSAQNWSALAVMGTSPLVFRGASDSEPPQRLSRAQATAQMERLLGQELYLGSGAAAKPLAELVMATPHLAQEHWIADDQIRVHNLVLQRAHAGWILAVVYLD
jgi:hypothetical protein